MAIVTANMVKELRERTGGGLLECKRALEAADGDIEAAIDAMRKSGQAKAAKKSGRIAAEGVIVVRVSPDHKTALMVEINCETDFVARDENFKKFADAIADRGLAAEVDTLENFLALPYEPNSAKTIAQMREELVSKIGENIQIRRIVFKRSQNYIDSYVHGSRIGALVELSAANEELAKDIAMHIVASNPQCISEQDVPLETVEREKAIYLAQAVESGKPQAIAEKMTQGRMQKFFAEITLLGQQFVKNPDMTVSNLLKSKQASVLSFVRFAVGEGIEKQVTDFAAEVKAQIK